MDLAEKSFNSATEASKLLITLSTAVTAFCVAVVNVESSRPTSLTPVTNWQKALLASSWFVLLLCSGAGIWVQLAITHVLSVVAANRTVTIWDKAIRVPYMLQIVTFVLGMALLVAYGGWRLFSAGATPIPGQSRWLYWSSGIVGIGWQPD
jgi:hypothetical protein